MQHVGVNGTGAARHFPLLPAQTAIKAHHALRVPVDFPVFMLRRNDPQSLYQRGRVNANAGLAAEGGFDVEREAHCEKITL